MPTLQQDRFISTVGVQVLVFTGLAGIFVAQCSRTSSSLQLATFTGTSAEQDLSGQHNPEAEAASMAAEALEHAQLRAQLEEATLPLMLDAMWAANVLDIESTLQHVCKKVGRWHQMHDQMSSIHSNVACPPSPKCSPAPLSTLIPPGPCCWGLEGRGGEQAAS